MQGIVTENVKDTPTMVRMCLSCDCAECTGTCARIEAIEARIAHSATRRRPAKMYTMDGETHTLKYWAYLYGHQNVQAIALRLKAGYSLKEALLHKGRIVPVGVTYTAFGITQTLKDWAAMCGRTKDCLRCRIKKGLPLEEAFREARKMCEKR